MYPENKFPTTSIRKPVRALLAFIGLILLALPTMNLKASHSMAQDFTYECIGNCTYRIYNRGYRDCSGATTLGLTNITFTPVSGTSCGTPTLATAWLPSNIVTEVTPICPSIPTNCTSGTMRGVEELLNYATYDFCSTSCQFRVTWSTCCRNAAITSGGANAAHYTQETIIDPTLGTCNNSPTFTSLPVFFVCQGDTTVINQGCYDQEGDSLVYTLAPCYSQQNTTLNYAAGYSATSPLGPSWNVSMDPSTGNVTFLPNPGNVVVGVFCVLVQEYRNGNLIGQLWRDVQVATTNCGNNNNPTFDSLVVVNGGTAVGSTITGVTVGNPMCFDLYVSDPDVAQTLKIFWDANVAGGSFFDPNNVTVTDTIIGANPVARFCFTPSAPGNYQFLATVEDNACPFAGFEDMFIDIYVGGNGLTTNYSALSCVEFQFSATPIGGTGPYTYSWTGSGGLSSSAASFTHTYPSAGTYTYSVTVTDTSGFNQTSTGSVTVTTTSAGQLIQTPVGNLDCQPDSVLLTASGPGMGTYLWSNGATTASTWVYTAGSYSVAFTDQNGCTTVDTVQVQDSIATKIDGIVLDYFLSPVTSEPVLLIYYNPNDSSLTAIDTAITDTNGLFTFQCPTQYNTWYLKAIPDSANYPNVMPTYYDSALVWQNALSYNMPSNQFVPILCRQGVNPGGPGFIGGLISQGANKQTDPVSDLRLLLLDDQGNAVGYTDTDVNGYFSFSNIAPGTYSVWVDKPFIDNAIAPEIEVGPQTLVQDSLPFLLHSTYLELMEVSTQLESDLAPAALRFSPNPFTDQVRLDIDLVRSAEVGLILHDAQGRIVEQVELGPMASGHHEVTLNDWNRLPAGLYFVEVRSGISRTTVKLVKTSSK